MMADNNEMIMECGQQAVAIRDEQVAEMQSTIDELTASLSHKDNLIAIRDSANHDHFMRIRDMKNMIQEREEEYNRKHNELEVEVRSLMRMNENESATREWYTNRFLIAIRDSANHDHFMKIRDMKNMIQEREEEYNRKHNELEMEIRSLMRMNENESATREWYTNRFIDEKNEFRQFKHDETKCIQGQGNHH